MEINQDLFDEIVDNALETFRLIAGQKRATAAALKSLEQEMIGKLSQYDLSKYQQARVNKLFKEIDKLIEGAYARLSIAQQFDKVAKTIADHVATAIEVVFGKDALSLPTKDYFNSLKSDIMIDGAPSKDWWRGQQEDLKFKFKQQIRTGLLNGETNQKLVQRIRGGGDYPGIMETATRNAYALVHTSVQTVANDARRETFKSNNDVINGIMQVSTLDSHTSKVCIAYSGGTWNLEFKPIRGWKLPYNGGVPRHMLCRSIEVPITKTFKELGIDISEPPVGERASDEGPIKADISFDSFLKRKSKAYQDEMLGVGRADLWRQGKITLRDLVDNSGRSLSLEELQARVAKRRKRRN